MLESDGMHLENLLSVTEPLMWNADKFKQRAAAEVLGGLYRGAFRDVGKCTKGEHSCKLTGIKHWPEQQAQQLWRWTTDRLPRLLTQIKPDTRSFWESMIAVQPFVHVTSII